METPYLLIKFQQNAGGVIAVAEKLRLGIKLQ